MPSSHTFTAATLKALECTAPAVLNVRYQKYRFLTSSLVRLILTSAFAQIEASWSAILDVLLTVSTPFLALHSAHVPSLLVLISMHFISCLLIKHKLHKTELVYFVCSLILTPKTVPGSVST